MDLVAASLAMLLGGGGSSSGDGAAGGRGWHGATVMVVRLGSWW